jgi:hypothetical protein
MWSDEARRKLSSMRLSIVSMVAVLFSTACGGKMDGIEIPPPPPPDAGAGDVQTFDAHASDASSPPLLDAGPPTQGCAFAATTLLSNLNYPTGLWVKDNLVYYSETAARNTSFGGALRVSSYDVQTKQTSVIIDNPMNSDAIVVASDGRIYLGSYKNTSPGSSGDVSVVDPITHVETEVVHLAVAVEDMYIDDSDDIYVIGPNDSGNSLYLLPAGHYASPVLLESNLGRAWSLTKDGADLYFSRITSGPIEKISNDVITPWGPAARNGLSTSDTFLYYLDVISNTMGRVDLATGTNAEVLCTGLNAPNNLRYARATKSLFFVEAGTEANHYKDGTLQLGVALP